MYSTGFLGRPGWDGPIRNQPYMEISIEEPPNVWVSMIFKDAVGVHVCCDLYLQWCRYVPTIPPWRCRKRRKRRFQLKNALLHGSGALLPTGPVVWRWIKWMDCPREIPLQNNREHHLSDFTWRSKLQVSRGRAQGLSCWMGFVVCWRVLFYWLWLFRVPPRVFSCPMCFLRLVLTNLFQVSCRWLSPAEPPTHTETER